MGFVVFVSLFFVGFWYVSSTAAGFEMTTEVNITETTEFKQTSNWLNSSKHSFTSDCEEEDNSTLYVNAGNSCTWTSENYSIGSNSTGQPYQFSYIADPEEGDIELTVTTYENGTKEEDYTYMINQGTNTIDLEKNFSDADIDNVSVEIYLNENNKIDRLEPSLEEYTLQTFDTNKTTQQGLTEEDTYIFTMIVFLMSGIIIMARFLAES